MTTFQPPSPHGPRYPRYPAPPWHYAAGQRCSVPAAGLERSPQHAAFDSPHQTGGIAIHSVIGLYVGDMSWIYGGYVVDMYAYIYNGYIMDINGYKWI